MMEVSGQPIQSNQNMVLQYLTGSDKALVLFSEPGQYEKRCVW
jgi:hypothetical protein